MSSSEGLERLKNWQRTARPLVLPMSGLKSGGIGVFEVRVKVSFVDESKLVLVNIDAPDQVETYDLAGATFLETELSEPNLQVTLTSGVSRLLIEEDESGEDD